MSTKKAAFDENKGMGKTKVKKVPDFGRLHQQWSSRLEQRKALSKKPCTIPCEFDVPYEKATFGRTISKSKVTPVSKVGKSPRAKATSLTARKSPGPIKFKENKDALNSILNEEGIRDEVTPLKSYSMYYRAGEVAAGNPFKTPMNLPMSVKKPANTTSMSEVNKFSAKSEEGAVQFESSKAALRGILNEEGIIKEVSTPRHFSMYSRTGQPLNSAITPSNILKSARKANAKTPQKREEDSSQPDDNFEANKDALNSILNGKGISDGISTPKYHSMYCRTGQPLRTPLQGQSVRKSIYYQAATTNGKDMAKKYSRQLELENGKQEKFAVPHTTMSLIRSTVAVPIRNSIYKKYCFSPVVKVTPSPRKTSQKGCGPATAPKSSARVCWADVLEDERSEVKDDLPTKLIFDDFDSPCYNKENMPDTSTKSEEEEEVKFVSHGGVRSPTIKKFPIFCDKDVKQSPSEKPKKGTLCPLSPNVNTPPRSSPRARDILHHNSPLKAVVSNKPRYYCPASPRSEHQVKSATDLINKQNMSPKRPATQDKEVLLQAELLRDDVKDLNMTLNESILKYDQLQEEADQLLSADIDNNTILMKLDKIRAKQEKLLKMEDLLKRKLKQKPNKVAVATSHNTIPNVKDESTRITKKCQSTDQAMETKKVQESDGSGNQSVESKQLAEETEKKTSPSTKPSKELSEVKSRTYAEQKMKDSDVNETKLEPQKHFSDCNQSIPDCLTPKTHKVMSTPKCQKSTDAVDSLVMPTPVRKSPESPTKRAYYFPAICTPLSMREMAGHQESKRDSLGRSPNTPEDICDSFSIDKSVDSSITSPMPRPLQNVFSASPASYSNSMRSPLSYMSASPMQLFMGSPASPLTLRGSLSLTGNINFGKPITPGRAAGLLLPAAVHRYHDALLDDEVSLYMCRLKRYGNSIYAAEARIQDPVAEVLTIGDEMHFIPVSTDDLLLGFSFQPLEGSAFSVLKTAS